MLQHCTTAAGKTSTLSPSKSAISDAMSSVDGSTEAPPEHAEGVAEIKLRMTVAGQERPYNRARFGKCGRGTKEQQ